MKGVKLERPVIAMAMRAVDAGVMDVARAAEFAQCDPKTMQRHRKQWLLHDRKLPPEKLGHLLGRPRQLSIEALAALEGIIEYDPLVTMEEIHDDMVDLGYGSISNTLISRTKKRLGITQRRSSAFAHTQDPAQRAAYKVVIGEFSPQQLVFVDESSFDYRVCNRSKALGHRGDRTWVRTIFKRGKRYSLLAACSLSLPMFAAIIDAENMDGKDFGRWGAEALIPMCQRFPLDRSVLVMDNCAIHKLPATQQLFADAGECEEMDLDPTMSRRPVRAWRVDVVRVPFLPTSRANSVVAMSVSDKDERVAGTLQNIKKNIRPCFKRRSMAGERWMDFAYVMSGSGSPQAIQSSRSHVPLLYIVVRPPCSYVTRRQIGVPSSLQSGLQSHREMLGNDQG